MAPLDEKAYAAALAKLQQALAEDDSADHGWLDALPEVDELPEDPDETQAVIRPKKV